MFEFEKWAPDARNDSRLCRCGRERKSDCQRMMDCRKHGFGSDRCGRKRGDDDVGILRPENGKVSVGMAVMSCVELEGMLRIDFFFVEKE